MKSEILKKLNCTTETEAIEKLQYLINRIDKEVEDIQTNRVYVNVRAIKINTLCHKKNEAQIFLNSLKQ